MTPNHGVWDPSNLQKRVPKAVPPWLQTTVVSTPNGTTSKALVVADIDHVLWAVNLGCLGFHVWPYRADDPGHTVACTCTCGCSDAGTPTRCVRPRSPLPASSSAAARS